MTTCHFDKNPFKCLLKYAIHWTYKSNHLSNYGFSYNKRHEGQTHLERRWNTSLRLQVRKSVRSSWNWSGCYIWWCGALSTHCQPPHSRLLCDTPPDSGYIASYGLNREKKRKLLWNCFCKIQCKSQSSMYLPLPALWRSLSRQHVAQLCWGQRRPLISVVMPVYLRAHVSW